MIPKLSEELQRALQQHGDAPVQVVHPGTNKVYFIIPAEQYERLRPLFEEEPLSEQEQRFLLQKAGTRAGWDEPAMDAYDDYEKHRSPS